MAWTYSGNPANSAKDKYRFLIGDTISSEPVLQDEEVQYMVDTYENHNKIMYMLYSTAANIFAREYKNSLGPQAEDPTKRQEHFEKQADIYRKLSATSGLSVPTYSSPKSFSKGMHNNV